MNDRLKENGKRYEEWNPKNEPWKKENSKLCGSRIACSLTLKLETVYGMVQRNGERDEKEDATDESYGITCMIERANYM